MFVSLLLCRPQIMSIGQTRFSYPLKNRLRKDNVGQFLLFQQLDISQCHGVVGNKKVGSVGAEEARLDFDALVTLWL